MFPYSKEYYAHLLLQESKSSQQLQFKGRSPQIHLRKCLIGSLKQLSNKLDLGATTFHVAVHLLDYFMDSHGIETHQLMLTASTCLFISAKYVDIDGNFPRISHLQSLNNFQNSTYEYKVMEILLLNFWKWNLNCATSLHFLEHIMASNLSPFCGSSFRRQAVDLVNLTLLEFQFISYKPSVIAASCIAVTRIQFQLFPVWPVMLETLTSYSLTDLCLCIQNINQIVLNGSLNPFSKVQLNSHPSLRQKMDRNKRDKSEKSEKSLKAPVMSHNGATIKRQNSLQPRDLKNLYYANI